MKRQFLMAAVGLLWCITAAGQPLPQGKWWRRPELIQTLSLTEDQQSRLDGVFRTSANELIDLRAEVEKQSIAMRGELDKAQLDRAAIQRSAARLSEARGRMFERELMMFVDMRAVLSDTQWNRMRTELDSMRSRAPMAPRGEMPRPNRRPNPPNRPRR